MTLERSYERFHTTRWTQIRQLRAGDEPARREAMDALVTRYWPAAYAYLRSRGHRREEAAELTQAFFAEVVLGRDLFGRADRNNGKLRSFLLTALKRFCVDKHRRGLARGDQKALSLEALHREEARLSRFDAGSSERLFERRWAVGLFEEALRRGEDHFRQTGRDAHWGLFESRIIQPAITGNTPSPLAESARPAGFASPALAAAAVQVVKRRISALLREVVAETLDNEADVDAELSEIRHHLSD